MRKLERTQASSHVLLHTANERHVRIVAVTAVAKSRAPTRNGTGIEKTTAVAAKLQPPRRVGHRCDALTHGAAGWDNRWHRLGISVDVSCCSVVWQRLATGMLPHVRILAVVLGLKCLCHGLVIDLLPVRPTRVRLCGSVQCLSDSQRAHLVAEPMAALVVRSFIVLRAWLPPSPCHGLFFFYPSTDHRLDWQCLSRS